MSVAMMDQTTKPKLFSEDELRQIDPGRVPKHIALIMDGNRRWTKKQKLPPMAGHLRGAEALAKIVQAACELDIEVLTVYAFSTENWKRPPLEVKALMRLFKNQLLKQMPSMSQEGIRLDVIGDIKHLPSDLQQTLEEAIESTKGGKSLNLVIALNYGGRDEICRATQKIAQDCLAGRLDPSDVTEKMFSQYLDTARWRDPDLLIRTSGQSRVSNFLLWQISYAEVLVTDVLWPDFKEKDLLSAVLAYQNREKRRGK